MPRAIFVQEAHPQRQTRRNNAAIAAVLVCTKIRVWNLIIISSSNNYCKSTTTFLLFYEVAERNYKTGHKPMQ